MEQCPQRSRAGTPSEAKQGRITSLKQPQDSKFLERMTPTLYGFTPLWTKDANDVSSGIGALLVRPDSKLQQTTYCKQNFAFKRQ